MTSQELTSTISALGFPIFLILAGLWFLVKFLWPWFVDRMQQRDKDSAARHNDFINAINRVGVANEQMAKMQLIIHNELLSFRSEQRDHDVESAHTLEIIESAVVGRQTARSPRETAPLPALRDDKR